MSKFFYTVKKYKFCNYALRTTNADKQMSNHSNDIFVSDKKKSMSLLATFETISKNFKLKPQAYIIDNWIFRLHYKGSVLIFLVSSLLVCSRQYIGEHIRCIADGGVPEHVMNTFCFFTSTFTVVSVECRLFNDSIINETIIIWKICTYFSLGSISQRICYRKPLT